MQAYVRIVTWLTSIPLVIGVGVGAYLLAFLFLKCGPPNDLGSSCASNAMSIVIFTLVILPILIAISILTTPERLKEVAIYRSSEDKEEKLLHPYVIKMVDYKSGKERTFRIKSAGISRIDHSRMTIRTSFLSYIFLTPLNIDDLRNISSIIRT